MSLFHLLILVTAAALVIAGLTGTIRDFGPWQQLRRNNLADRRQRHLDWISVVWGTLLLVGALFLWSHLIVVELTGYALFLAWYVFWTRGRRGAPHAP